MRRVITGISTVVLGLSVAATGHAKNITVWAYGDGQTSRMLSEFNLLSHTGITVVRQEQLPSGVVMEGSGPLASTVPPTYPRLDVRVQNDLAHRTPTPNLIHIGYSASAWSYFICLFTAWTPQSIADAALAEAQAITAAATVANNQHVAVMLSKPAGIPTVGPLYQCMQSAYDDVVWDLAVLAGQYGWVDYSGKTALLYAQNPSWYLDPANSAGDYWEHKGANPDYVHLGENCSHYSYPAGQPYTAQCVNTTGLALGSYRVANSVRAAYQFYQTWL